MKHKESPRSKQTRQIEDLVNDGTVNRGLTVHYAYFILEYGGIEIEYNLC